jgi:hypothetical protein
VAKPTAHSINEFAEQSHFWQKIRWKCVNREVLERQRPLQFGRCGDNHGN